MAGMRWFSATELQRVHIHAGIPLLCKAKFEAMSKLMDGQALMNLFASHLIEGVERLKDGARLVHYTSAENAYRIISGKQVWLRNAHLMNDYSEMQHGLESDSKLSGVIS